MAVAVAVVVVVVVAAHSRWNWGGLTFKVDMLGRVPYRVMLVLARSECVSFIQPLLMLLWLLSGSVPW